MWILGLCAHSHDSAAALFEDGKIVALIEEERMNREKYTIAFPFRAIEECLRMAGISIRDVDHVGFFTKPSLELYGGLRHAVRYFPGSRHLLKGTHGGDKEAGLSFLQRVKAFYRIGDELKTRFGPEYRAPVHGIEHHLAHAASCFYPSPYEKAAILTWDGRGEYATTVGWIGEGHRIKKGLQVDIPHSIGHLYAAITDYLGFKPFADEWKVMGMSAYGERSLLPKLRSLFQLRPDGGFRLNLDYFSHQHYGRQRFFSERFLEEFGPPRSRESEVTQRHFDFAASAQAAVEEIGLHFAKALRASSQCPALCMTGGVAQNILLNSLVFQQAGFNEVFVQPVATDAGTAWGAALCVYHQILDRTDRQPMGSIYLGPSYTPEQIEEILRRQGIAYRRPESISRWAAGQLAAGKIVAWFQGRMEAGPRALGNRSLLANPCEPGMKDRLNSRIKRRENFRPFAPAVLAERAHEFFADYIPQAAEFMITSGKVAEPYRERIPAVVHVDGTARVQTVTSARNPLFYDLIAEFGKLTGLPIVLNTSFNEQEPIVCTPEDALRTYQRTLIDAMALGPFALEKSA